MMVTSQWIVKMNFLGVCARRNEREYEEKNSMDSAGGNDTFPLLRVEIKPEIRLQMMEISLQRQQRVNWIHRQIWREAVRTFWMRFIKQQKQMTILQLHR